MTNLSSLFLVSLFLFTALPSRADLSIETALSDSSKRSANLEDLENQLKGAGLTGWVHGAVNVYDQYVFTYREPGNFFDHQEFPLTTTNPTVKEVLKTLTRHDQILVKGSFIENHAPIKHITAQDISIVKKFEGGLPYPKFAHQTKLPAELLNKTELVGKVHAIGDGGSILVIEYGDAIIPVYVKDPQYTKDLYRNDKIRLQYTVRVSPQHPTHVSLNLKAPKPLIVTDRLVEMHGKPGFITGTLVMFPKSPQVSFNVFALQQIDENGVKREFTLLNFDDAKIFAAIRAKLQEWWDTNPGNIVDGRNKYLNLNVTVKATGTFNVVDPGQANGQIILSGPEALERIQP